MWNIWEFMFMSTQNGCSPATFLIETESRNTLANSEQNMAEMASDGPIPLPCSFAFPPPSNRNATTPSPCWAPHFMTQERIMFSNPTPSKLRLSAAATMSDDTQSALTPPLHCASIMQPAAPPQVFAFESWTISAPICLNRFTFAEWRKSDLWTCVCVFTCSSSAFPFFTYPYCSLSRT